jgi:hypothetical protein
MDKTAGGKDLKRLLTAIRFLPYFSLREGTGDSEGAPVSGGAAGRKPRVLLLYFAEKTCTSENLSYFLFIECLPLLKKAILTRDAG